MKNASKAPPQSAGGIVVHDDRSLIAIVRLRKNKAWVLPKGKLKAHEDALTAAKREVLEETGHEVSVHEYLGAIPQTAGGRRKTVEFWRMQAKGPPVAALTRDVKAVRWLPLDQAIKSLSYPHERAFLQAVGPSAIEAAWSAKDPGPRMTFSDRLRSWFRVRPARGSPGLH